MAFEYLRNLFPETSINSSVIRSTLESTGNDVEKSFQLLQKRSGYTPKSKISYPSKLQKIFFKTNYTSDLRRFSLDPQELSFAKLDNLIRELYQDLPKDAVIKYRDDEGDLISITSDFDLNEAFNWLSTQNKNLLYLFILLPRSKNKNRKNSEKMQLIDVADLFLKLNIDDEKSPEKKDTDMSDIVGPDQIRIIKDSEWCGLCFDESTTSYPFILHVTETELPEIGKKLTFQGTITWETLGATTKFLGLTYDKVVKFTEYEAIVGQEYVELPNDYEGTFDGHLISGKIVEQTSKFQLRFSGVRSIKYGFLSILGSSSSHKSMKRKYNLFVNDTNFTSEQDRVSAFKKLTAGTEYWYDISKKGELETRPKKKLKVEDLSSSCKRCGEPMVTRPRFDDPSRTTLGCANYKCKAKNSPRYDDDDDYYSYSSSSS